MLFSTSVEWKTVQLYKKVPRRLFLNMKIYTGDKIMFSEKNSYEMWDEKKKNHASLAWC